MNTFKTAIITLSSAALMAMSAIMPAQAGMIGNVEAQASQRAQIQRTEVLAAMNRSDVQEQLVALGVDVADAKQRVAALSDDQIAQLNAELADMPAGSGVIGVVGVVFVVLIVLELVGVTNVFTSF